MAYASPPIFIHFTQTDLITQNCCAYFTQNEGSQNPNGVELLASQETLRQKAAGLMGCGDVAKNKINGMEEFSDHSAICLSNGKGCGGRSTSYGLKCSSQTGDADNPADCFDDSGRTCSADHAESENLPRSRFLTSSPTS